MADYQAPLRDMRFVLNEVFDAPALWASLPKVAEHVDPETADAILEEAGKISSGVLAPLNREGDEQGCKWNDGEVTSPDGFKEAYQTIVEGGWNGLGGNPDFGGMGMPKTLVAQFEEMMQGANMAFGLAPMLTAGACLALDAHGSDELKEKYLPNMYSGVWSGAMDLTEPHAGTDLGIIRTKAEPNEDGSFNVTGTKIFITWGEHELAENIIHLVLARTPNAPEGSRGISLFVVPKFHVKPDGSLGSRNDLRCVSIEHKLGINASPTCVMSYGDNGECVGELVGAENRGLAAMFTMMNNARINVGNQGVQIGERATQQATDYAAERIQSARAGSGDKEPVAILEHPDVRRMILRMKALTEGARALLYYTAGQVDRGTLGNDDAKARGEVLTPLIKAWGTDIGIEVASLGVQVHGGMGFTWEVPLHRHLRQMRAQSAYGAVAQATEGLGDRLIAARTNEWYGEIEHVV